MSNSTSEIHDFLNKLFGSKKNKKTAEIIPSAEITPPAEITHPAEITPSAEITPPGKNTPPEEITLPAEITPPAEIHPPIRKPYVGTPFTPSNKSCKGKGPSLSNVLEHNAEHIGPHDEFVSVYLRVKEVWWGECKEVWDYAWKSMSTNPIFNAVFRDRLCSKLAEVQGQAYHYGDLNVLNEAELEAFSELEKIPKRVLNFLLESDFLASEKTTVGVYVSEEFSIEEMCTTVDDFSKLMKLGSTVVQSLDQLLLSDDFTVCVEMLDQIATELGLKEADIVRILNYSFFPIRLRELVEGTTDAIVLFGLPRSDGIFLSSSGKMQHIKCLFLRGAMQELILERDEPLIMLALKDAGTFRMNHTVHSAFHDRMVNEGLTVEAKIKYKSAYSIVRSLPVTKEKNSIMKPYEWAAVALKVFGMDPVVQQLVMEAVGSDTKKKSSLVKLEKVLSEATDIDAMVAALRIEAKRNPLVLRLWSVDLNASIPVWTQMMEEVGNCDLAAIARMIEYKIFATGLTVKEGQRVMIDLMISAVHQNDMKSSFFDPVCKALYARVKNQSHKRSRKELENFVSYVGTVVGEVEESDDEYAALMSDMGSYEPDPELLRLKLAKRVKLMLL